VDPTVNPAFLLFAAVAPLLIALIKQSGFPTQANAFIAFACYVVVGIAGAVVSGEELNLENIVPLITVATVVGTAAYNLIWYQLGKGTDEDPGFDALLTELTSFKR
jgi:hypothetical protein